MKRKNPVTLHIGTRKRSFDSHAEAYRAGLSEQNKGVHSAFVIVDSDGTREEYSRAGKKRNPEPKVGQRYLHSKWLDSTYEVSRQKVPQLYEITKVSGGTVYSRPVYATGRKGAAVSASLANFERYVKEYVSHSYKPPAPEYTDFKGNPNAADEYVRKTRHPERKRYAAAWLKHLRGGLEPNSDDYKGLSYMARQGVRLSLDKLVENKQNPKRNPESAARAMREAFVGTPSKQTINVTEEIHVHEHLAALGELVQLKVKTLKGETFTIDFGKAENPKSIGKRVGGWLGRRAKAVAGVVGGLQKTWINPKKVNPNGAPILAVTEDGKNLMIVGGSQALDLKALGMGEFADKESVIVGSIKTIDYFATKDWKDGKKPETAIYTHRLNEETGGPLPMLRYDTRNRKCFIDGGLYQIKRPLFGQTSVGIEN